MKLFQSSVLIVLSIFARATLANPQMMQGGGDPYGGGGGMQQGGGGMHGGGGGMQGGGGEMQGGQPALPKTKPCGAVTPAENANLATILTGRWYVTKLYCDLIPNAPSTLPVCIYMDSTNTGVEEVNLVLVQQGSPKNISGTVSGKTNGDFNLALNFPTNGPPLSMIFKIAVLDAEGDNVAFYGCGGQQGFYIHVGLVASRGKNLDPNFGSKLDPKFKFLEFKSEGLTVSNQNCQ